jgi:hypothetical protein
VPFRIPAGPLEVHVPDSQEDDMTFKAGLKCGLMARARVLDGEQGDQSVRPCRQNLDKGGAGNESICLLEFWEVWASNLRQQSCNSVA